MHVSSTLRQLWRTARKTPVTVALALISTLMVTLCDIVIPLITATAIDSATAADGAAWAEAVRDLLLFPERAQEMGLAAHESVRREFLSNRHLQDLLDIVADLVG